MRAIRGVSGIYRFRLARIIHSRADPGMEKGVAACSRSKYFREINVMKTDSSGHADFGKWELAFQVLIFLFLIVCAIETLPDLTATQQ